MPTSEPILDHRTKSAAWSEAPAPTSNPTLFRSAVRIFQRHVMPQFAVALYYSLRDGCMVSHQAKVQMSPRISFGKKTVVKPYAVIQAHKGRVQCGERCAIGMFNYINGGNKDLTIGNYVRMGPHVTILGSSRVYDRTDIPLVDQGYADKGVTVGDDVLIGANAVILDGCHIGTGTIIGAGSVVTRDTPSYSIVAGVPARIVGERGNAQ